MAEQRKRRPERGAAKTEMGCTLEFGAPTVDGGRLWGMAVLIERTCPGCGGAVPRILVQQGGAWPRPGLSRELGLAW